MGADTSNAAASVSMRPLQPSELPKHPLLQTYTSGSSPGLQDFIQRILDEGHALITNSRTWRPVAQKTAAPAKAPVKITKHSRPTPGLPGAEETWFQRTSLHDNKPEPGTASFAEFDHGLRANHSKNERQYTPGIVGVDEIVNYNDQLSDVDRNAARWANVDLYMVQMRHKVPAPLSNRIFAVLVAAGTLRGGGDEEEFVHVQIPVQLFDHVSFPAQAPHVVHAVHASVERGSLQERGAKVKWQMATAAHAKGILPLWLQKLALPAEIAKDVGRLVAWRERLRKEESRVSPAAA